MDLSDLLLREQAGEILYHQRISALLRLLDVTRRLAAEVDLTTILQIISREACEALVWLTRLKSMSATWCCCARTVSSRLRVRTVNFLVLIGCESRSASLAICRSQNLSLGLVSGSVISPAPWTRPTT